MKKIITVTTKYGIFRNVPNTNWKALEPVWPDIISSIIESILENDFTIKDFRIKNRIHSRKLLLGKIWGQSK